MTLKVLVEALLETSLLMRILLLKSIRLLEKLHIYQNMLCGGILFTSLFLTYEFSDLKRIIFSFLLGVEYAAIDEIHQLFVEGRSGQVTDVLIDSIGILLGICGAMAIYKIILKIADKRKAGASGLTKKLLE